MTRRNVARDRLVRRRLHPTRWAAVTVWRDRLRSLTLTGRVADALTDSFAALAATWGR